MSVRPGDANFGSSAVDYGSYANFALAMAHSQRMVDPATDRSFGDVDYGSCAAFAAAMGRSLPPL